MLKEQKNEYNRYWIFISTDAITPEIPGIFTGGVWRREVYRLRKIGELEELCSLQEEEIRECEERLGGIGDQTEMSGNGMEKLSQGTEFKDSGKRTGTLGRSGRYYQIYNPLLNLIAWKIFYGYIWICFGIWYSTINAGK